MMKWIGRFVIRFPKTVIALVIAITLFFGYFIPQVKFNNDARDFIPPGDPERQYNEECRKFSATMMSLYWICTENIYTPQKLAKVANSPHLKDIDGVDDVTSLSTTKNIEGTSGGMDVYPFVDEDAPPETAEEAQKVQEQVQKWEILVNNLVSADGKATSIVVKLNRMPA